MPIAARQAISYSSLLSLALPAALFASFAQANAPEPAVASLEDQATSIVHQICEQAPRDHREDALLLEVNPQASEDRAAKVLADSEQATGQPSAQKPHVLSHSVASHAPSFIVPVEPGSAVRQARHDFKALGVPVLRSIPLGNPGTYVARVDAASGDQQRERKVDLKYVARSDAARNAGSSLAFKVNRYRLDRSAGHSRQRA
ncbi:MULTISPECIES: hypothetical protein [unclassified Pseudomonas]|uniref:hypothetical protein n=1 Tax=unclassified Pseudomonas TaxID=196821 RepID=UPI0035BF45C1